MCKDSSYDALEVVETDLEDRILLQKQFARNAYDPLKNYLNWFPSEDNQEFQTILDNLSSVID